MDEYNFRLRARAAIINDFSITNDSAIKAIIDRALDSIEPSTADQKTDFKALMEPFIKSRAPAKQDNAPPPQRKMHGQRHPSDREIFQAIRNVHEKTGYYPNAATKIGLPEDCVGYSVVATTLRERGLTLSAFYEHQLKRIDSQKTAQSAPPDISLKIQARAKTIAMKLDNAFNHASNGKPQRIPFYAMFNTIALHVMIYETAPVDDLLGVEISKINTLFGTGSIIGLRKAGAETGIGTLEDFAISTGFVRKDDNGELQPILAYEDARL